MAPTNEDKLKFNTLALNQQELNNQLKAIIEELKKSSTVRTRQHTTTLSHQLEEIWSKISNNHKKCEEYSVIIPQHDYVTKNYYGGLVERYMEARTLLQVQPGGESTVNITAPTAPEGNTTNNNTLRKHANRISDLEELIEEVRNETNNNLTLSRYNRIKSNVENLWKMVEKMHYDITDDEQLSLIYDKLAFRNVRVKVDNIIEQIEQKILAASYIPNSKPNIALPQVKLPIFESGYNKWVEFHDVFQKVIHDNNTISDVEKLQYLKSHTKGEAAKLIQHLSIADNNYRTAWETLIDRYHNKRLLIAQLIDAILDQPECKRENALQLKNLHDTTRETLKAIENLGFNTETWGPIICRIVIRKWDTDTNRIYEQSLTNPHAIQSLSELLQFLEKRFQSLEGIILNQQHHSSSPAYKTSCCRLCHGTHELYACLEFNKMSPIQRGTYIKERKICQNCLCHNFQEKCYTRARCKICNYPHHTMLHVDRHKTANHVPKSNQHQRRNAYTTSATTNHNQDNSSKEVLLATAMVNVSTIHGMPYLARVLIDQGSQSSFITEQAVQELGLTKQKISATINGLGNEQPKLAQWKVYAHLKPRFSSEFVLNTDLIVLPKLTNLLPSSHLPYKVVENWNNDILADPNFNKPGRIDIILGADELSKVICNGLQKKNNLIGQNTEFGWIISGSINQKNSNSIELACLVSHNNDEVQLTKFWEMEEIQETKPRSKEEEFCEEYYVNTTVRNQNGTYTVRLPLKEEEVTLGNSKPRAAARLLQLERKLEKNEQLKKEYHNFMQEYIDLGHMKPAITNYKQGYYIPHQAVIRTESTTTKLRVVFDASSKTDSNINLNEKMYTGPQLQNDLSNILLKWRRHKFVFTADIEKMFRQIKMHKSDQKYQKILWRFDPSSIIKEYQLTTITYGTSAAPYLAIRTLHQLAIDEEENFSKASAVIKNDVYVDDILTGAETITEAIRLQKELITLMSKGGFKLHKWSSNDDRLTKSVIKEATNHTILNLTNNNSIKSLGVLWSPNEDTFAFQIKMNRGERLTKRFILSEVSKIFDPLGCLAPIIIKTKLLIQNLWIDGKGWDEPVSDKHQKQWQSFYDQIRHIEDIKIERWLRSSYNVMELHGFCDASEKAYGAVVYSRAVNQHSPYITLLQAKSKVAPLKSKPTLPRLELCAAVLLAKLLEKLMKLFNISVNNTYAWSDSMITLSWIQSEPYKWNTFVSNRVTDIQLKLHPERWHYVKSEENPADIISRGIEPKKLKECTLWWNGPWWLKSTIEKWSIQQLIPKTIQEEKINCHLSTSEQQPELVSKFSNLTKMLRILSYCRRFGKQKKKQQITYLEMHETMNAILKTTQIKAFKEEYTTLQKRANIAQTSSIASLSPFLDEKSILRVGGRLSQSQLSFNEKHPIILPRKHHLTKLILLDAHEKTLHGGVQATAAYIKKKYWVPSLKRNIKGIIHNCVKCIRYKAVTSHQLMGQLPAPRVTPSRPFTHTGVDYAGPIFIRTTKGRGNKSYKGFIAVFICLATKAIHLEAVSDMTTDTFLAAFRRFTARRGTCNHMYSDNGTTFVGAAKFLKKEIKKIEASVEIQNASTNLGTQWHFIPTTSPHFGGLWEAGVKSVKFHLKRIIGDSTLTYEEITTLLYQIEACLNSRPLCVITNDLEDSIILTPGHFLIGQPLIEPPNLVEANINSNLLERWRLVQKIKKDFWKAWSTEYLTRLQHRYKWKTPQENLKKGTVVIIKENNVNPSRWPLAKIAEIHSGLDGKVRTVTLIKTTGTTTTKAITNLIPLPVQEAKDDMRNEKISANYVNTNDRQESYQEAKHSTSRSKLSLWKIISYIVTLLLLCTKIVSANYTIEHPAQGLYIEHLGEAEVNKGIFKLEVIYNIYTIEKHIRNAQQAPLVFAALCNQIKSKHKEEMDCLTLTNYLKHEEEKLLWIKSDINEIIKLNKTNDNKLYQETRTKRGILGTIMTKLFGVNDEVYEKIDSLNNNQEKLKKISQQQSKIMLATLKSLNDSEVKITQKIKHFQQKMDSMSEWVRNGVQYNKVQIGLLHLYHRALIMINEVVDQYSKITKCHFNKEAFFDIVSPAQVANAITSTTEIFPDSIKVLRQNLLSTEIDNNNTHISIYGLFPIVDTWKYSLLKVTPTPVEITTTEYKTIYVPNTILALNYNKQLYFELTNEEFQNCERIGRYNYTCYPAVIKHSQANCIINELYQHAEQCKHKIISYPIKTIIWKQMTKPNTWMFITNRPTTVGVLCNGERHEPLLNSTGIIHITEGCVIQTNQLALYPTLFNSKPVLGAYTQGINFNISRYTEENELKEPVLKVSDDFSKLVLEENQIGDEIDNTTWDTITRHINTNYFLIAMIVLALPGLLWVCFKIVLQACTRKKNERPQVGEIELVQLP